MGRSFEFFMAQTMRLLENKNLRNQMMKFVVTGFCGLFTDVSIYRLLVKLGIHVTPAKALGCLAGTVVVFFINRAWTFSARHGSATQVLRFGLLYGTTIMLNTTLNTIGLKLLPHPWQVAFVFATGITTVINFLGSKFVVFRPSSVAFIETTEDPDFFDGSPDKVVSP
ncbi:MAG: GtrA family protein [Silvanigrellaceae bacterium]